MSSALNTSRILVAVDGSAESDAAVRWAARESGVRHAPVTLVHVITPAAISLPAEALAFDVIRWSEDNSREVLQRAEHMFRDSCGSDVDVRTEVIHCPVVPALVDASKDAQLIVVGSRGLGAAGRAILGSVSTGLIHRAHCPVAVIHDDQTHAPDPDAPVLLGVDGSQASEAATALAFDEASRRGVGVIALHAFSDFALYPMIGKNWAAYKDEGNEVLAERLAGWQERYPDVHIERQVVCDMPGRWLIDESERAQLVVVGSHGRGGFAGMLLGSVSSAVAQAVRIPVIVARNG